jgi:hypothetical protein
MALEKMASRIEISLAPTVPPGQRQQDGPTPVGRQAGPFEGEQILDPQLGASAMELGSHRAGR